MANNLKKVSSFVSISPTSMSGTDLFYLVHSSGGSTVSYSLLYSDLFLGCNNLSSNFRFNDDTLYVKSGKVGINKEPTVALDVEGRATITGNTDVSIINASQDVNVGNNITASNDVLVGNDISVSHDATISGTANVAVLKSANAGNPKSSYAELINIVYPVGSIFMSGVSTNPATLFGVGTWIAWGTGRVPVGIDVSDTNFNVVEKTGGSKDAVIVNHAHSATSDVTDPGHMHYVHLENIHGGQVTGDGSDAENEDADAPSTVAYTGISVTTTIGSTGVSGTNANIQPYIVCYMWKRTA